MSPPASESSCCAHIVGNRAPKARQGAERVVAALPGALHAQRVAHAGKQGRRVVSAFIGTAFAQEDVGAARAQWRQVADQLRPRVKKLAELMAKPKATCSPT